MRRGMNMRVGESSGKRDLTRAFVALDPPLGVRQELAAWLRGTQIGRQPRPVSVANMHLTLAFLGSRDVGELSLIASILDEHADVAPTIATGAPLWLPPRRPRTLTVEIREVDSDLTDLQSSIATSLAAALNWQEPRGFRPHITVARLPRDFRPPGKPLPPTPPLEFTVESLTLYRSILLPEGAEYEAIQSWSL